RGIDHATNRPRKSDTTMQTEKPRYCPDGQTGLKERLEAHWLGIDSPRILEAGCGSSSNIPIHPNAHVVGIDISAEELDKNTSVHEKIVGDLETCELPKNAFDLVVCFDVLEHLHRPALAMASMASAVRPGGLLLLAFPNVHWNTRLYQLSNRVGSFNFALQDGRLCEGTWIRS
ncbi:MAG: class I SAM-dependent methyltransferase, partial [Verrucomicrobia bacterium]|nr:class I SAM-dependent methyltransferase [Verrucomicrobiota bacterium]